MAPRRGGGGGSGIGSVSSCPGAFSYSNNGTAIVYFVSYCLFFVVTLLIMIGWARVRKRHSNAKRLVGGIYGVSLLFLLISYALLLVGTVLRECQVGDAYTTYYNFLIAWIVFCRLSQFLLLVVVVWGVNNFLRQQQGKPSSTFNIICGVILAIMGALTAGYIGVQSYNYWAQTDILGASALYDEVQKLALAYWVLYLVAVVIAGVLSIVTVVSMRPTGLNIRYPSGWIIALTVSMFIWVIFIVVQVGANYAQHFLTEVTFEAFEYVTDVFSSIAYIALLFIAKSPAFKPTVDNNNPQIYNQPTYTQPQPVYSQSQPLYNNQMPTYAPVPVPAPQQQYAYNANGTQQYYHQQHPVYNGPVPPANRQVHTVELK